MAASQRMSSFSTKKPIIQGVKATRKSIEQAQSFDQKVKFVQTHLEKGQQLIRSLHSLRKHLGTKHETQKLRQKLFTCLQHAHSMRDTTHEVLEEMAQLAKDKRIPKQDKTMRRHQHSRLSRFFIDYESELDSLTHQVKEKEKERELARQLDESAGDDEPNRERVGLLDQQEVQTIDFEDLANEIEFNHSVIVERRDFVAQMEQDMLDVEEMYNDFAVLVQDQGHRIDDIETAVHETHTNVQKSAEEVRRAKEYQITKRNKLCCLLFLFTLAGLGIIVFLKATMWHSDHGSDTGSHG